MISLQITIDILAIFCEQRGTIRAREYTAIYQLPLGIPSPPTRTIEAAVDPQGYP